MNLESIALTTDFSPCARRAYPTAVELARLHGAQLHLVHVDERKYDSVKQNTRASVRARDHLREELLLPVFENVDGEATIISGGGAGEIAPWALDAGVDLIVTASHGYSGLRHLLLGSFAEVLLRSADVPVLTVKGEAADFKPKRILMPLDFSQFSVYALEPVRLFAERFEAQISVVHVLDDLSGIDVGSEERIRAELEQKLKTLVDRRLRGLSVNSFVLRGAPAEKLLSWVDAADIDLICMATRGTTNSVGRPLGSVTEKIARMAPCPVLTVRSDVSRSPRKESESPTVQQNERALQG